MFKKLLSLLLIITLSLGTNTFICASEISAYEITEEYVRIDYVEYEIKDNAVQYNGRTYEIVDYSLISYEEDGTPIILVLPVEQNRITDPEQIAELNAITQPTRGMSRALPTSYVTLPYTKDVPKGQWMETTPYFKMIEARFYYYTIIDFYNFPLFADKRFAVKFMFCSSDGEWYDHQFLSEWRPTLFDSEIKYKNTSDMKYGVIGITNLYGNPSPSYTYTIRLTNLD